MGDLTYNRITSASRSLELLGERWMFLILRECFFGVKNYNTFLANLGVATNILSDRLKKLVDFGILEKKKDTNDSRKFAYHLTEKGLDLYQITLAFTSWVDKWLNWKDGPPLVFHHKICDHTLIPVMCCIHCGKPVHARDVTVIEKNENKINT